MTAKRAPGSLLEGGWSGWSWVQRPPEPWYHPLRPLQGLRGPLRCTRPLPASWPIRARFQVYFLKVSQNRVVSPKSSHKASHSPCFKNGLRKSPLDFLRFPICSAFSHKELMGRFDPQLDFIVKMTKCRSNVHYRSREGVGQIPPRSTRDKLATVDRSSSDLSAVFSTVSVLAVLQEIMTETWFWRRTSNEACGRSEKRQYEGQSEVNLRSNLRSI